MKHSKKKKTLLGIAPSLAATGITLMVRGNTIEGAVLIGMSSLMLIIYDALNDRGYEIPEIPEGVDEKTFEEISEIVADRAKDYRDSQQ